jgi:hypothetical protein
MLSYEIYFSMSISCITEYVLSFYVLRVLHFELYTVSEEKLSPFREHVS